MHRGADDLYRQKIYIKVPRPNYKRSALRRRKWYFLKLISLLAYGLEHLVKNISLRSPSHRTCFSLFPSFPLLSLPFKRDQIDLHHFLCYTLSSSGSRMRSRSSNARRYSRENPVLLSSYSGWCLYLDGIEKEQTKKGEEKWCTDISLHRGIACLRHVRSRSSRP